MIPPYLSSSSTGKSQRNISVTETAAAHWATINPGTSTGCIPANVSLNARATVTAGFAKDVDAVNQ
jgi:hypothetical protein